MKTPGQIIYETVKDRRHSRHQGYLYRWEAARDEEKSDWEAAAQAVLANQWRSAYDPPEDTSQTVLWANQGSGRYTGSFLGSPISYPHWMPIPAIPAPSEEEKSRAEFEKFVASEADREHATYSEVIKARLWTAWQAARKSKEGQKP